MTAQSPCPAADAVTVSRAELLRLADKARFLEPDHHDPQRFHDRRWDLEKSLRRLAGPGPSPSTEAVAP